MKKATALTLLLALLLSLGVPAFAFTAKLSTQALSVDGALVDCEKYNIDGSNYFKLRDLAALLNGTGSQFDVGYDSAKKLISITTNHAYTTPNGTELIVGEDQSAKTKVSPQTIMIDGVVRDDLTAYNIGGNNFFQLRQMGDALGFDVDYATETRTMLVTSQKIEQNPFSSDEKTLPLSENLRYTADNAVNEWIIIDGMRYNQKVNLSGGENYPPVISGDVVYDDTDVYTDFRINERRGPSAVGLFNILRLAVGEYSVHGSDNPYADGAIMLDGIQESAIEAKVEVNYLNASEKQYSYTYTYLGKTLTISAEDMKTIRMNTEGKMIDGVRYGIINGVVHNYDCYININDVFEKLGINAVVSCDIDETLNRNVIKITSLE